MKFLYFTALVFILSLLPSGCGGSGEKSSKSSAPADLAGTWKGTASSQFGGSLNITLTLAQQDSSISGSYVCSPGTITCLHASGTISGTVSGNTLTLGIVFPDGHSCGAFDGTVSGNVLSGSYTCDDPVSNDSGIWTANLQ